MICPACGYDSGNGRPPLTKRQHQVIQHLRDYQAEFGYMPTLAEIARDLELSAPSTVFEHIRYLEKKGYVIRTARKFSERNIQLVG